MRRGKKLVEKRRGRLGEGKWSRDGTDVGRWDDYLYAVCSGVHRQNRRCMLCCGLNGCPVLCRGDERFCGPSRRRVGVCGPGGEGRMIHGWFLDCCSVQGIRCLDGVPATMCEWHGRFAGIVVRGRCSVGSRIVRGRG